MRPQLIALLLSIIAAPAFAQSQDDAVADVLACETVRGTKARLKCFEAALPALRAAHPEAALLSESRAEAVRRAASEEAKEEFGLDSRQAAADNDYEEEAFGEEDITEARAEKEDEVDSIEGRAIEIGKNARGKLFVVLDNGQVWRQIDADSSSPYFPKDAEGLAIRIRKGLLGSYFVKIGGAKDAFKARRVK